MENYTWNLNDLEYIDFDKPWWDTNAAEQLSVGNSLYMMIGDFNLSSTCGVTFLWFNKQLLTDKRLRYAL